MLFCFCNLQAQELNCNLVVNAQQTGNENVQVFKTLEKQLSDFVNNTQWTSKEFGPNERIDCSMVITIQNYNSDTFQASIQVQSARPVYNSNYSTPVYNFNDKDFNFQYLEYQNLNFNKSDLNRIATAAHSGIARAIEPSHTPFDGDIIFSATSIERFTTSDLISCIALSFSTLI